MEGIAGTKDGTTREGKSKGGRNNKDVVQGTTQEGSTFWRNLRILLGCMPFNSKGGDSSCDKRIIETKFTNDIVRQQQQVTTRSSSRNRSRSSTESCSTNLSQELLEASSFLRSSTPNQLQLVSDLQLEARNFRAENFLGEEGFGTVFKGGVSQNENCEARHEMGTPVAVKSLNLNRFQGYTEWLAEINYLSELHHPNLVELVGFSIREDKMLLVYEYMCRGSLEKHLFRTANVSLPWPIRMKIAIGAAKGLAFLHEEASRPVIFGDFKTSKILLDMNYNAKLSNFGLPKDAPVGDASHVTTQVMETQGYAAPEYVMTGHLTSNKSDVYSFGVVLLEILTGRRAVEKRMPREEQNLVEWLRHLLIMSKANFNYLMDPRLEGQYSVKGAEVAMRLATDCLRYDPKARPLMSEVVRVLMSLPIHDDMDDQPGPSTSIPSTSHKRMHVGLSNSNHGANKYGLKTGPTPNVPRRFQASPLNQDYPLPPPNPSVGQP
ncbi:putative serine/threonine-protein kinase PIX7, partial [Mucuna pruriens]